MFVFKKTIHFEPMSENVSKINLQILKRRYVCYIPPGNFACSHDGNILA